MADVMTPKQRVYARLAGEPVDVPPNVAILMSFAARYGGVTMDQFCQDYRALTTANLKAARDFGLDILSTMSDPYRETADLSGRISFPHDAMPVCPPCVETADDLARLRPVPVAESTRMLDRIHAIEEYVRLVGDEFPILGWVEGSLAEAADLMGLTALIYAVYDDPDLVRGVLDLCCENALGFIRAQVAAGADIIGLGDAVASVMGPDLYREWGLPYEKTLFAEVHRLGAIARLHICGNITPLLDDIRECGADIVDVDSMVDFAHAAAVLAPTPVCGNIAPVDVIKDGTPDDVAAAVRQCVADGGPRCFIMGGCEIPVATPHANLAAIHEALVS